MNTHTTMTGRLVRGVSLATLITMGACGTSHGFSLTADGSGFQSASAAPAAAAGGNTIVTGQGGKTQVLPPVAGALGATPAKAPARTRPGGNIITGAKTVDAVGQTVPVAPVTGIVSGTLGSTGDAIVRSRSKPTSTRAIVDGKGAVGMTVDSVGAAGTSATGNLVGGVNKTTGVGKVTGSSDLLGVSAGGQRVVGSQKPAASVSVLGKRPPKADGAAVGVLNNGRAATVTLTPPKVKK